MYDFTPVQPTPPPEQKKTGRGIKAVCAVLAIALIGSILFFSAQISELRSEIEKNASVAATGDPVAAATLEAQISELKAQLNTATAKLNDISYTSLDSLVEGQQSLIGVAAEVKSTVVLIRVTIPSQKVQSGFFIYSTKESVEEGTGIILSEDGYIATNEHVISSVKDNKNAYIDVIMDDGTEYTATLVGSDSTNDLAVIKIDASGLSPIKIGTSASLSVGEIVLAVGNPLGSEFAGSVTMGIVSALDRKISEENTSQVMIQHDAAINPGNSGGALVNSDGLLVGINTSKISSTAVEGLGFAIPVDYAMPILEQLIEYGYVRGRVTLGLSGETLSGRYASYYGLPEGLLVTEVVEDSGADLAGIRVYDVITQFGGKPILSMTDIEEVKAEHSVGDVVEITYYSYQTREYVTENLILMEDKTS